MKEQVKVWTRIFPNIRYRKNHEVRMGKGKGSPEYACRVKPGRIIFEIDGVSEEILKIQGSAKLQLKLNL